MHLNTVMLRDRKGVTASVSINATRRWMTCQGCIRRQRRKTFLVQDYERKDVVEHREREVLPEWKKDERRVAIYVYLKNEYTELVTMLWSPPYLKVKQMSCECHMMSRCAA